MLATRLSGARPGELASHKQMLPRVRFDQPRVSDNGWTFGSGFQTLCNDGCREPRSTS